MAPKFPQNIPVWVRIVGITVALGLTYFLYRGGTGGIVGTVITICALIFVRSLYKSGAMDSTTTISARSVFRPRSFASDALIGVGTCTLAFLWVIAGVIL